MRYKPAAVTGLAVGSALGLPVGAETGVVVGIATGTAVGPATGMFVGLPTGGADGAMGDKVGEAVGIFAAKYMIG